MPVSSAGLRAQQGWKALNKGRIHSPPRRMALVLALCSQRHPPVVDGALAKHDSLVRKQKPKHL